MFKHSLVAIAMMAAMGTALAAPVGGQSGVTSEINTTRLGNGTSFQEVVLKNTKRSPQCATVEAADAALNPTGQKQFVMIPVQSKVAVRLDELGLSAGNYFALVRDMNCATRKPMDFGDQVVNTATAHYFVQR